MRRRALCAASAAGGGSIFPMHLNLKKISDSEYRLDPTPESIALCDYFVANAVFDGVMGYELFLNPGNLYIDGIEVQIISANGNGSGIIGTDSQWWPYHERYDDFFMLMFRISFEDEGSFPKGTFIVFDDE